jgi:flagellin
MAQADFTRIATNIGALNALQSLRNINDNLGVHQMRLSTGKRINSAADDPAGLTIATKMLARSEGLKVALDNIGDAKNLLSVAESGLGRINDILVQMRNKAEAAASDTLGTEERDAIKEQLKAYVAQIDDIVEQTQWNDTNLIDGTFESTALTFQTGADQGDTTTLSGLIDLSASGSNLNLATLASSSSAAVGSDSAYDVLTDASAPSGGNTLNANLSELGSGTYTVEVTYGGTLGDDSSVRLLDSAGNALLIDANGDPATGDSVDKVISGLDLSGAGSQAIDFGNGVKVNINKLTDAGPTANGTYTATVSYAKAGTYSIAGDPTDADGFATYMQSVQDALDTVSGQLSKVGALMGRLTFKEDQVSVAQVNVEASYNRIMNADMAFEQLESTKLSILQQTAITMLAQANVAPQGVLSLFR